jgi:hypothetical protein
VSRRLISLALMLLAKPAVFGCAACFGRSDSPMAYGMNAGIMTLLAVILSMLALIATFFVFIVRRAAQVTTDVPESTPPSNS